MSEGKLQFWGHYGVSEGRLWFGDIMVCLKEGYSLRDVLCV